MLYTCNVIIIYKCDNNDNLMIIITLIIIKLKLQSPRLNQLTPQSLRLWQRN